jgi:hypothetical protein
MIRIFQIAAGIGALILTVGMFFQQQWALDLWPWRGTYDKLSPLSSVFVASIYAAIAAPVLWLGIRGEQQGGVGGAMNIVATFGGSGVFMLSGANGDARLQTIGAVFVAGALLVGLLGVYWVRRPLGPLTGRTPPLVRWSFAGFVVLLLLFGTLMVTDSAQVFPWRLTHEMSVVYGWAFIGAAFYFGYGVLRPFVWNMRGQLLAFLAYDLILIGPYLRHLGQVEPGLMLNLLVYIAVLLYSGGLAVWGLFLRREVS